jgi:hypothetical protein
MRKVVVVIAQSSLCLLGLAACVTTNHPACTNSANGAAVPVGDLEGSWRSGKVRMLLLGNGLGSREYWGGIDIPLVDEFSWRRSTVDDKTVLDLAISPERSEKYTVVTACGIVRDPRLILRSAADGKAHTYVRERD